MLYIKGYQNTVKRLYCKKPFSQITNIFCVDCIYQIPYLKSKLNTTRSATKVEICFVWKCNHAYWFEKSLEYWKFPHECSKELQNLTKLLNCNILPWILEYLNNWTFVLGIFSKRNKTKDPRFKVNIFDYIGFKIILIKQKITSVWFRGSICF